MSDQPPFRLSPQVGIIVAVVLLALVIPIVAISYYFRAEPAGRANSDSSAALAPLQESLEAIADENLAGNQLRLDSNQVIVLKVKSPSELVERADQFLVTAQRAGATVVETGTHPIRRWTVMAPASRTETFRDALAGKDVEFDQEAGAGDSEIFSVEIQIEAEGQAKSR